MILEISPFFPPRTSQIIPLAPGLGQRVVTVVPRTIPVTGHFLPGPRPCGKRQVSSLLTMPHTAGLGPPVPHITVQCWDEGGQSRNGSTEGAQEGTDLRQPHAWPSAVLTCSQQVALRLPTPGRTEDLPSLISSGCRIFWEPGYSQPAQGVSYSKQRLASSGSDSPRRASP